VRLYFGHLHAIFQSLGIDIDLEAFIVEQNWQRWIFTTALDELMMQLVTAKIPRRERTIGLVRTNSHMLPGTSLLELFRTRKDAWIRLVKFQMT